VSLELREILVVVGEDDSFFGPCVSDDLLVSGVGP
jgi:hypothetical protein